MRTRGLGFVEFRTPWSSSKDESVGTVEQLTAPLREILIEEEERRVCGELPDVAVVPVMKRKSFKELGSPTAQAKALATCIKELDQEELLAAAQLERERLEQAGEIDAVADAQPAKPPPVASLEGKWLELRSAGATGARQRTRR